MPPVLPSPAPVALASASPITMRDRRRPPVHHVEETCRSALNRVHGMPFAWSLNPYGGCAHRCTFCYVRAFEQRADRPADGRYGRTVRVKTNVVEVLRAEVSRPGWGYETIAVGTATDPYQPAEGRYRLTRGCLEVLAHSGTPLTLTTRGTLVVRDVDVLADLSRRGLLTLTISLPTLDEEVVRRTEPGTAPPRQRLRALRALRAAGVRAGIAVAPVLPGISDGEASLTAVVRAAREADAAFLWSGTLRLAPGTREHFLACLERDWPELAPVYRRLFAHRTGLPRSHAAATADRIATLRRRWTLTDRSSLPPPAAPARPHQLVLTLGAA